MTFGKAKKSKSRTVTSLLFLGLIFSVVCMFITLFSENTEKEISQPKKR